ncbi:hypothetical protein P171DRAFT_204793 [Karstenula rhodostoma CBS 690.94]|uniref:Uncharacterized protein n=1 Tax=Karstenula rhodostoma CBS 690.94 TaxID=1392251 RepID=A0A9P4PWH9_9PLEO|nr:hypothetical protein P171DRAFT_204793 [Karstenula rhodostoma CBS 690.94]
MYALPRVWCGVQAGRHRAPPGNKEAKFALHQVPMRRREGGYRGCMRLGGWRGAGTGSSTVRVWGVGVEIEDAGLGAAHMRQSHVFLRRGGRRLGVFLARFLELRRGVARRHVRVLWRLVFLMPGGAGDIFCSVVCFWKGQEEASHSPDKAFGGRDEAGEAARP